MGTDTGVYFWHDDDEIILFVTGRMTATEAYAMYRHLEPWLSEHDGGTVFLDLDQTIYMDSTTVGTLIKIHKEQKTRCGRFFLCNPSDPVRDIIRKTKLDRYFSIIDNTQLRDLERSAIKRMPIHEGPTVDGAFVLEAHNDICEVAPEMKPQFQGVISLLRRQLEEDRASE